MNNKYRVVPSGKAARRIMLIDSMMKNTDVELVIKEMAALEQFDSESFEASLTPPAQQLYSPAISRVMRYAYDCDYRMVLCANDLMEFARTAIFAGLAANSGPIMLYYGLNYEGLHYAYKKALEQMGIDFDTVTTDRAPDFSKKCIIFGAKNYNQELLKDARNGVLVTSFDIEQQQYGFGSIDTNSALMCEFQKVIAGYVPTNKNSNWWESNKFKRGMSAMFPESMSMVKALTTNPAHQGMLREMGFELTHPQQLCRLMNVCSDYIFRLA